MDAEREDLAPVLDDLPGSVAVYDLEARMVWANRATERIFGLPLEQMRGRRLWDLFPEAVGNTFHQAFDRVAAGGEAEHFDFHYPPLGRWFRNRIARVDGRVHVLAQDVTEEVERAEEAGSLRRRLEAVADSTSDLVSFIDRDLRYQYVNASYERWFEQPRGWFIGRHLEEALGDLAFRSLEPQLRRALEGSTVRFQATVAYATGARHIDAQYQPVAGPRGDVEGLAVTVRDMTAEARLAQHERERLEAERAATRRLQSLLAATGRLARADRDHEIARVVVDEGVLALEADLAAMWLLSGDGRELVLQRHQGFSTEQRQALGRLPFDRSGPLSACVGSGRPVWLESRADYAARFAEFERAHRPAAAPPLVMGVLPLAIEGRTVGCITFTFYDERRLTPDERTYLEVLASHTAEALRRARLYAELRASYLEARSARLEAEAASGAKDQFLAMLGHELRNPLAPITTALQLMRLRAPGQVERERAVIERQVAHLSRLVDDLLDVSRITRGKVELRRERVSLASVVAKAIEQTSPLLEQRSHRLEVEVPRELEVDGDPVRLGQVVANLLANAAKYTDAGGRLEVLGRRAGPDVALTVRDDGIGIGSDVLPRLFDLFVQAPQPSARTHGGLGLGLAIVRSLVEAHGGRVTAHSDGPGRGSEFTVVLPAAPKAAPLAAAPGPAPARPPGVSRRVLVVDDNEDAATLMGDALRAHGHEIRLASDGPSALRVAEEFRPEIAVLDLGLPVMDGYELAQRLKAEPTLQPLRLIALSGYGQESDRARTRAAGFAAHLTKPVPVEALTRLFHDPS